jgi:hypothetical protein
VLDTDQRQVVDGVLRESVSPVNFCGGGRSGSAPLITPCGYMVTEKAADVILAA